MKTLLRQYRRLLIALTLVTGLATSVYAASLTLTIPAWTAGTALVATASPCSGTLVQNGPSNTNGIGTARFDCGGTPTRAAAFTATVTGGTTAPDTPTFTLQTLPTGSQTFMGFVSHSAADCTTSSGVITLTSGVATQLANGGSYDICIGYTASSTTLFTSSTIAWSS